MFNEFIPKEEFLIYNETEDLDYKKGEFMYMIDELPTRHTEENANKIMKKVTKLGDLTEFGTMDMDYILSKTKELRKRGISYGQISRAIHKNKGTVFRWHKKAVDNETDDNSVESELT